MSSSQHHFWLISSHIIGNICRHIYCNQCQPKLNFYCLTLGLRTCYEFAYAVKYMKSAITCAVAYLQFTFCYSVKIIHCRPSLHDCQVDLRQVLLAMSACTIYPTQTLDIERPFRRYPHNARLQQRWCRCECWRYKHIFYDSCHQHYADGKNNKHYALLSMMFCLLLIDHCWNKTCYPSKQLSKSIPITLHLIQIVAFHQANTFLHCQQYTQ